MKIIAKNKRATFDYAISDTLIAGLSLLGNEVKSIKAGHISLKGTYIALQHGEAFLIGAHVTPYSHAYQPELIDPIRNRKLLLQQKELKRLIADKQLGKSVIPISIVLMNNYIKIEIGIGTGKKLYDKRSSIKQRDQDREIARSTSR